MLPQWVKEWMCRKKDRGAFLSLHKCRKFSCVPSFLGQVWAPRLLGHLKECSPSNIVRLIHSGAPTAFLESSNTLGIQDLVRSSEGLLSWDSPYQFERWTKTFLWAQGVTRQFPRGPMGHQLPQYFFLVSALTVSGRWAFSRGIPRAEAKSPKAHPWILASGGRSPVEAASSVPGFAAFTGLGVTRPKNQGLMLVNLV